MNYKKKYLDYKLKYKNLKKKINGGASKNQYFTINKSDDNKTGHKYRWHDANKHFLKLSDKRFENSTDIMSKKEFLEKYDIWSASIEAPDIKQIFDEDDVKYVKLLEKQNTTDLKLLNKDFGSDKFKYTLIFIGYDNEDRLKREKENEDSRKREKEDEDKDRRKKEEEDEYRRKKEKKRKDDEDRRKKEEEDSRKRGRTKKEEREKKKEDNCFKEFCEKGQKWNKCYKKKALKYHPDKQIHKSPEEKEDAVNKFKELNECNQIIS